MANVDIDVGGKTLNVDIDGLESMSPDQQQATVSQVSQHMMAPQGASPAAPADTSYAGAFGYGLHGAAEGLGATAKLIGKETGWQGAQDAGTAIQGTFGAPKGYLPTDIGGDLKAGNYGSAISSLPRAAVEAAVPLAATLGAGVAGSALGPAGTAAGVGAMTAGLNAGDNVAARQASNGEDPNALPSTNDLVGAGLTTGAQVAGNLVGLGKLPGIAGSLEKIPLAARIPAQAALEGAGAGATNLATQVGDTVDTVKGLTVDPYQAVGAGLQGAAARAGSLVPGAGRSAIKAGSDEVMSRLADQPVSLAHAAAISQTNELFNEAMAQAVATKGDTSPQAVMNSLKGQVKVEMISTVNDLSKAGLMDSEQSRSAKEVILNEAYRHNNTLRSGDVGGTSTLFDALGTISGMPEAASKALQGGAMVLDNLSGQSFQKNGNGPIRQLGTLAGHVGGVGAALTTGNPMEIGAAFMGQGLTAKMGGLLGGIGDQLMGTNTPPAVLQAARANAMLKKAGLDNGGNPLQNLRDVRQSLASNQAITGNAPDSVPVNTPIPPTAQPVNVSGSPVGAPPEPISAAPLPIPQEASTQAPAAPVAPANTSLSFQPAVNNPAAGLPAQKAGWQNYISQNHSAADINDGLDSAVKAGVYNQAQADAMKAHTGPLDGTFLRPLQDHMGITPQVRVAAPLVAQPSGQAAQALPPGYRGPIFDPAKYREATAQYQAHTADKLKLAASDPTLQAAIVNIRDEPSAAKKQAMAASILATLHGDRLALAQQLLTGPLLQSKVP